MAPLALLLLAALGTAPEAAVRPEPPTGPADGPPAATPGCAGCARLRLTIAGVRNGSGQLLVNVFTAPAGWPRPEQAARALRVPAVEGDVQVEIEGLPDLPFAVSVVHDENGNGTLDMAWLPFPRPREGTAASNGATGTLGPPSFAAALVARRGLDDAARLVLAY